MAERTRIICRLRWHVHEIDPGWDPPARSLILCKHLAILEQRITPTPGLVARLALELIGSCRELTARITALETEIGTRVALLAPALLSVCGCGVLTTAKIIGETAGITRFRSKDAFARHNGTAPLPVWSGNRQRHRLSRSGNRQLNAALHRIAVTQARHHGDARAYLERRRSSGSSTTEALRSLKRRLSDVVYRALVADAHSVMTPATTALQPFA